jgi:SAM-dependent methyltransferase
LPDRRDHSPKSVREAYAQFGVETWYSSHGDEYRNPHEEGVRYAVASFVRKFPPGRVLDLACGSGEVTLALRDLGVELERIDGCDPFTGAAYRERTGKEAHPWSFIELTRGLQAEYGTVVCSFALHLCPPSWLPLLVRALASSSRALLVLTPHKRPELRSSWGMVLEEERYFVEHRVRARFYRSDEAP